MIYVLSVSPSNRFMAWDYVQHVDAAISQCGDAMHFQNTQWFLDTQQPTGVVYNFVRHHLYQGDELAVARIYRDFAVSGLNPAQRQWLLSRNFGSIRDIVTAVAAKVFPSLVPPGPPRVVAQVAVEAVPFFLGGE